jgi:hypothetical protein
VPDKAGGIVSTSKAIAEAIAALPRTRIVYGTATGDNTVPVEGDTTAVEMPAIVPVSSGDYCAVAIPASGDRIILGPVDASTVTLVRSTGDATAIIEADTDNVSEDDNPTLVFKQDAGGVTASVGLNSSNTLVITPASDGKLLLGSYQLHAEAWQDLTLSNSWAAYDAGGWADPQYRKVGNRIELRGLMKNGTTTSGTIAGSLPAGYRPSGHEMFLQPHASGYLRMDVEADGDIIVRTLSGGGSISSSFVSLAGISFSTA